MNCREIIIDYLDKNGYDGLVQLGLCGCNKDDLFPCFEDFSECTPAYINKNPDCKNCKTICEGYDEDGKTECYTIKKQ